MRNPPKFTSLGSLGQVCRLGLATRGDSNLQAEDVLEAIERGVNYLNWCGHPDGMSRAVCSMAPQDRAGILVAVQLSARDAGAAARELAEIQEQLGTDVIDIVTYYYVEHEEEWARITAPGGAAQVLEQARAAGTVRAIGLTSHQRPLAARIASGGRLDLLMIRYNAAHRGAEREIFPITRKRGMPVVTFTSLRWGALTRPTPDDPPDFRPPSSMEWYRFALCHPDVGVALMAPSDHRELVENLNLLHDWRGLEDGQYAAMQAHGDRVRRHAGNFL